MIVFYLEFSWSDISVAILLLYFYYHFHELLFHSLTISQQMSKIQSEALGMVYFYTFGCPMSKWRSLIHLLLE